MPINAPVNFPKWKHSVDPVYGFASTLVGNAEAEAELGAAWVDDPHALDASVVPYPAELTPGGTLMHNPTRPDANGNHAHGPAPTAVSINGVVVQRK